MVQLVFIRYVKSVHYKRNILNLIVLSTGVFLFITNTREIALFTHFLLLITLNENNVSFEMLYYPDSVSPAHPSDGAAFRYTGLNKYRNVL